MVARLVGSGRPIAALCITLGAAGCGARTELEIPPVCEQPSATRPCESICGSGVETCTSESRFAIDTTIAEFRACPGGE